ncbi:preprotein translocase, SecE subunit [Thermocrinis albus DSM 14484]|uniref:Protein translocase subunit SecE n=1 Tax=Thermocrinis albus (strain DSM 14484 / JCM 11386 / HI 11/12) TaxID=638303 RepID=D3SQ28_THEAH|nr:preprotein translocase subunit SecE [Thermocrinis albus]ADC89265.1 preprotein translocase, SecE subunit [Thermocrinis albus DSM 14484]
MEKVRAFLKGVKQELGKVSWPTKDLVVRATVGVIIFSLLTGLYLWVVDLAFTRLISFLLALRGG